MPITKPTLPARAGYVEVTDENGNRVYKPTKETEEKLQMQAKMQSMPEEVYAEMAKAYQEGVEHA